MNIPKLSKFNKTHYLILLTVISLFAGLAASLGVATKTSSSLASSNQAQAANPSAYNHSKQTASTTKSASKTTSRSNKISKSVRNPFTVPRTPVTKTAKSTKSRTKRTAMTSKSMPSAKTQGQQVYFSMPNFSNTPILRGLLQNGQEQLALIEYQGESRACHIGENLGNYKLTSISDNSITLQGPQGQLQLQLNQTGRAA